jgi:hypothetical protein
MKRLNNNRIPLKQLRQKNVQIAALRNLYEAIEELCDTENVSTGRVQGAMATARRVLAEAAA